MRNEGIQSRRTFSEVPKCLAAFALAALFALGASPASAATGFEVASDTKDLQLSVTPVSKDTYMVAAVKDGSATGLDGNCATETERVVLVNPPTRLTTDKFHMEKMEGSEDLVQVYDTVAATPEEVAKRVLVETYEERANCKASPVKGSVGHTTYVVYPQASVASTAGDAYLSKTAVTFAAARDASASADNASTQLYANYVYANAGGTSFSIRRGAFSFDLAEVADCSTVASAAVRFITAAKANSGTAIDLNIYGHTPANPAVYASADFNLVNLGATAFSATKAYANIAVAGGASIFALNADGLTYISQNIGGVASIVTRDVTTDVGNTQPANSTSGYITVYSADLNAETAPKLTVVTASECGNSTVDCGETCDDGNVNSTDGCSATCAVELGWECSEEPSQCAETYECGDGVVYPAAEQCDDGNDADGDGCSALCAVEEGYGCTGEPSECVGGAVPYVEGDVESTVHKVAVASAPFVCLAVFFAACWGWPFRRRK